MNPLFLKTQPLGFFPVFSLLMVLLLSLPMPGCKSKDELVAFSKCEFRVKDATDIILAGVPLEGVDELADLTLPQMLALYDSIQSGSLPLTLNVNVEIKNPNSEVAALEKAEWKLYVDDQYITEGVYEERIEIPKNGGIAVMTVPVSVDMVELMEGESGPALLNLALNLANAGSEPSKITLQAKPYVRVGGKLLPYPGFFDVKTEFTSGD